MPMIEQVVIHRFVVYQDVLRELGADRCSEGYGAFRRS
jgi:hypothetical protein